MRILILSQYYWPETDSKPSELAQSLRAAGDEVTVITGFPDYPSGRLYDGYSLGLLRRESVDGIPVVRTFEYPYHGTRSLGRMANYLSFLVSAPLGGLLAPKADVMYVWHPPLTIGVAAWLIARLRRIPSSTTCRTSGQRLRSSRASSGLAWQCDACRSSSALCIGGPTTFLR